MELHHKLRRDPNWHPSGCNICGQLGHQAAQCTTGTVNWRAMYGENAFTMRRAVFQSELDAIKKSKQVDFSDLEKRAKDYAQMRQETGGPPPHQAPPQRGSRQAHPPPAAAAAAAPMGMAQAAAAPAAQVSKPNGDAQQKKPGEDGLPDGWAVAFDAQKRPYFWHKTTKKVTWDKPTADTPIN